MIGTLLGTTLGYIIGVKLVKNQTVRKVVAENYKRHNSDASCICPKCNKRCGGDCDRI